jgi:hypothetical protein
MACACGWNHPRFGSSCDCGSTRGCGSFCACGIKRVRIKHFVQLPLAPLGELRGVIYRASRAPGEVPKNYVHFFRPRLPLLATDPTGRRLYIVGGEYQVTKLGIEG